MSSTRKASNPVTKAYHFVLRSLCWMTLLALCLLSFSGSFRLQLLVLAGFGVLFYWRIGRHVVRFMWAPRTIEVAEPKTEEGKQQAPAAPQNAAPAEPAKKRTYAKSIVTASAPVTPAPAARQPVRVAASAAKQQLAFAANNSAVVLPFARKS